MYLFSANLLDSIYFSHQILPAFFIFTSLILFSSMAASSLYFPATFRIDSAGILPSRCRRPSKHQRMMLVRSDLEKNVSDMSTNGYSSSSNNMASGAISHQPHLVTHSLAKNMFSTPGLSLALQTSMEGQGEVTRLGENNYETSGYVGGRRRSRDEEHESSSGSDNMDGASGDDQDADDMKQPTKKRYHRHTPQQIQELESLFKECPHPDEKQRLELSRRLSLSSNLVGNLLSLALLNKGKVGIMAKQPSNSSTETSAELFKTYDDDDDDDDDDDTSSGTTFTFSQ